MTPPDRPPAAHPRCSCRRGRGGGNRFGRRRFLGHFQWLDRLSDRNRSLWDRRAGGLAAASAAAAGLGLLGFLDRCRRLLLGSRLHGGSGTRLSGGSGPSRGLPCGLPLRRRGGRGLSSGLGLRFRRPSGWAARLPCRPSRGLGLGLGLGFALLGLRCFLGRLPCRAPRSPSAPAACGWGWGRRLGFFGRRLRCGLGLSGHSRGVRADGSRSRRGACPTSSPAASTPPPRSSSCGRVRRDAFRRGDRWFFGHFRILSPGSDSLPAGGASRSRRASLRLRLGLGPHRRDLITAFEDRTSVRLRFGAPSSGAGARDEDIYDQDSRRSDLVLGGGYLNRRM